MLDELWALAPFLIVEKIGIGLALGATVLRRWTGRISECLLLLMGFADTREAG